MSSSNGTSDGPTQLEQNVFLAIKFTGLLAVILLECLTLPLFLIHADYRRKSSHQIMFHIGVFDLIQIIPDFVIVVCGFFGSELPQTLGKAISAMSIVFWDVLIFEHFVLAINRAYIIVIRTHFQLGWRESDGERWFFRALNGTVWICGLTMYGLFQTSLFGATIKNGGIYFDKSAPGSVWFQTVELPFALSSLGASLGLYLIIALFVKKTTSATSQSTQQQREQHAIERRIMCQAIVLFIGISIIEIVWYFIEIASWLVTKLFGLFFIAYCGLNPVLYLVMIKKFRHRFLQLYRLDKLFAIFGNSPPSVSMYVTPATPINHNRIGVSVSIMNSSGNQQAASHRQLFGQR